MEWMQLLPMYHVPCSTAASFISIQVSFLCTFPLVCVDMASYVPEPAVPT